ncbi:MAG: CBS domain-containing protein [Candidatus Odinarchaeia archaeon]
MKVWEVMSEVAAVVELTDLATKARQLLRQLEEFDVHSLPVVENGKAIGLVTHRDVLKIPAVKSEALVKDIMSDHPLIESDMDILEAFDKLKEYGVREAPVIKSVDNPQLIGIISVGDILNALIAAGYQPKSKYVWEIITPKVDVISPDVTVDKVWNWIVKEGKDAFVVVEDGSIWGIVTPYDLVKGGAGRIGIAGSSGLEGEGRRTPAKVLRVMQRGAITANQHLPLETVANFMVKYNVYRLPVIDFEGNLVGIVTQLDVAQGYLEGAKPEVKPIEIGVPTREVSEAVTLEYAPPITVERLRIAERPIELKLSVQLEEILEMPVSKIMSTDIPIIKDTLPISHAVNIMLEGRYHYLLVADKSGDPYGVVSRKDLIHKVTYEGPIWRRRPKETLAVKRVTKPSLTIISSETTIREAVQTMLENDVEFLLVAEKDTILGAVSKRDILAFYAENLSGLRKISDVIRPREFKVNGCHSLKHVMGIMETNDLDFLVVTSSDGSIEGVISASYLPFVAMEDAKGETKTKRLLWVRRLEPSGRKMGRYVKIVPLTAEDLMRPPPSPLELNADAAEAARRMIAENLDGLPVTDNGELCGVVTSTDLLVDLVRVMRTIMEKIKMLRSKSKAE